MESHIVLAKDFVFVHAQRKSLTQHTLSKNGRSPCYACPPAWWRSGWCDRCNPRKRKQPRVFLAFSWTCAFFGWFRWCDFGQRTDPRLNSFSLEVVHKFGLLVQRKVHCFQKCIPGNFFVACPMPDACGHSYIGKASYLSIIDFDGHPR